MTWRGFEFGSQLDILPLRYNFYNTMLLSLGNSAKDLFKATNILNSKS